MLRERLSFNGINGLTGAYLASPQPVSELSAQLMGAADLWAELRDWQPEAAQHMRTMLFDTFGPPASAREGSLAQLGWGVIFAHNANPAIYDALGELLALRREQAGDYYKEYRGPDGYRVGSPAETYRSFLARQRVGLGGAIPRKVPYYLLIVGGPESIPFSFQYKLDLEYAVGRIFFERVEDYARYAQSVVRAERSLQPRPRLVLAGTAHDNDPATQASSTILIPGLAQELRDSNASRGWSVEARPPGDTKKSDLLRLMGGEETPAVLFTATHGVMFPELDERQRQDQGGLVSQDWPGAAQSFGKLLPDSYYIAGRDINDDMCVSGSIFFHFACFSAGSEGRNAFAYARTGAGWPTPPPAPYVAALPQRLLSHPRGGALAVIGYINQAWTMAFRQSAQVLNLSAFLDFFDTLMLGGRVGLAMESMNIRCAEIANELVDVLASTPGEGWADSFSLPELWATYHDAQSCIILGDPAVRIMVPPLDALRELPLSYQ